MAPRASLAYTGPMESTADPLIVRGLRKRFGRLEVLRGVDLRVPRGSVYGLLGLNGAGKTTTLRCVLGLLFRDGGDVSVLGHEPRNIHRTRGDIGAVFDDSCLHGNLTVRQSLDHARMLCGGRLVRPARELEALLGLEPVRSMKVRKLSRGNLRRANIAAALVARPSLLVLDEPFAGLDAGGVDDVLALIRRLHEHEGTSVLLASHQLPYLEGICTHVSILHGGTVARSGTMVEVLDGRRRRLTLRTSDPERAVEMLSRRDALRSATLRPDGRIVVETDGDPAAINRDLVGAGFAVSELSSSPPSLEDIFREVTGRLRP